MELKLTDPTVNLSYQRLHALSRTHHYIPFSTDPQRQHMFPRPQQTFLPFRLLTACSCSQYLLRFLKSVVDDKHMQKQEFCAVYSIHFST